MSAPAACPPWTYGVAVGNGFTQDAPSIHAAFYRARKAVWGGASVATVSRYRDTPDGHEYVLKVAREGGAVAEYVADYGPHGGCWMQA